MFIGGLVIGILIGIYIIPVIKKNLLKLLDYVFTYPTRKKFNSVIENNYYNNKNKGDYPKVEDV